MAKLGQQPDRSGKGLTGLLLNFTLDAVNKRFGWIAKMVSAMKTERRGAANGPQPAACEDLIQFGQIEIDQVDSIAKRVAWFLQSPVSDPACVDAAKHDFRSK